jgi:hypothetical protein
MASTPEFGFNELFASVIGDIAKAVSERSGETAQQQFYRSQAAVHMIMGFLPRDVVEVLLAGHCVMLHATMLASVHDTLLGEADAMRRSTRSALIAMNKEFNGNLHHLERYQARPVLGCNAPAMRPTEVNTAGTETTVAPTASGQPHAVPESPKPSTATRERQAQPVQGDTVSSAAPQEPDRPVDHDPEAMTEYHPSSPEMLAECQANPEAMAALTAGDPECFAKAPAEAANTQGSPFDQNATGPGQVSTVSGRPTDQP